MTYLNINGKIIDADTALLPVDNGAFRYGYGLFETMLVRNGAIELLAYHKERLYDGMKQLYLKPHALLVPERFEEQVLKTAAKNKIEYLCRVRLQVFAGGGGLYAPDSSKSGFVIECFPMQEEITQLNENGLVLGIAEGMRKSNDKLSHIKSCNALIYAMAAREAKINKWNDALICNTGGNIIESTIANIFWIKDRQVYTPPLSEGCIAGVMRRHLMDKTPEIKERQLTIDTLMLADEVFLTNVVRGIKWVGMIGEKKYGNEMIKELR